MSPEDAAELLALERAARRFGERLRWTDLHALMPECAQVHDTGFDPWRVPWVPTPKQRAFLKLDCPEALYGGAAGGGKSGAKVMGAVQFAHVPGYSAIILRRTFRQLKGADGIIAKSHEVLAGTDAVYSKSDYLWTFPSGATLRFGHIENEGDESQYDGEAFQYVGFDELTHFTLPMYRYLFSRMRRPREGPLSRVPLRMRGGTNPGGIGHDWVVERFALDVNGKQDTERARGRSGIVRVFVQAFVHDNAANLDVEVYKATSLSELDSIGRAQKEDGLWIRDGQGLVYGDFLPARNLVDAFDIDGGPWAFVLAVDLGASETKKTTGFAFLAYHLHERNRVVGVRSWKEAALTPQSTADRIGEVWAEWELEACVVDAGALGKGYLGDFQRRFGEACEAAEKRDKLGARRLLNGALKSGDLVLVEPENTDLIAEIKSLPWDKRGLDAEPGFDDHLTDALLYGWRRCSAFASSAPATRPSRGSPEWMAEEERRMESAAAANAGREDLPWYATSWDDA